jgi:hypothetical protein
LLLCISAPAFLSPALGLILILLVLRLLVCYILDGPPPTTAPAIFVIAIGAIYFLTPNALHRVP